MACSQAVGIAQTSTVCQFCEESPEIKWKCVNCELFLCNQCCSKIHSKSKASMEHEIISIKDFESEDFAISVRKVDLQNMVCTIHAKQKCFIFCKDCSQPACSKCLMETHKMHDYRALDEEYNEIFTEMKEQLKQIGKQIPFFKNEKDKLLKMLSDGDINFQETRENILQMEKELKEAISKHAKHLLQELEEKWKPSENIIKTELSVMIKKENELETMKNNLHKVLQSHQVKDILSERKTIDKSLPKSSVKNRNENKFNFFPSSLKILLDRPSIMIGTLFTVPDFELEDTFESDNIDVSILQFSSDNTAVTGSFSSDVIQKVKFENHKIKEERKIQMSLVNDIVFIKNEEMLVSSRESDLKLCTKEGQLKTFKSFSPLKTSCVHVTKDNKIIIVGLVDTFPVILPAQKDSIRRLVIMNQDGDIQKTIESGTDNQTLFIFPYRILTCNDKIVVVDLINKNFEGRLMMLGYNGNLDWTFKGSKCLQSEQVKFYPNGLAITSKDIILVSDSVNHSIHVLNVDGEVIVCKDLKNLGIELPCSLCFDNNEVLWIGCSTQKTQKKAKIHRVKLT